MGSAQNTVSRRDRAIPKIHQTASLFVRVRVIVIESSKTLMGWCSDETGLSSHFIVGRDVFNRRGQVSSIKCNYDYEYKHEKCRWNGGT